MLKCFITGLLSILLITSHLSFADTKSWQEEVKLLDGRVIVISQQRRFESAYNGSDFGGVPRESWLKVKLPETSNIETTWNEKLEPSHLNIVNGKLYIVAQPPTTKEFYFYDQPNPPYIGYVFENKSWHRIPFSEIPLAIYDTNLSLDSENSIHNGHISIIDKEKIYSSPRLPAYLKRIDPDVKIPGFPKNKVKVHKSIF